MEEIKRRLTQKYPFMEKVGEIHESFNKRKLFRNNRKEKLLIFLVGVQGVGKTTYCKKNFPEYQTINIDEILKRYLESYNGPLSLDIDMNVKAIFFSEIEKNLNEKGLAIVEAGVVDLITRVNMLSRLQNSCSKIVLLILNQSKEKIIKQIKGQIYERARPGLWEDVDTEFGFLQIQIENHIIEMGVDEIYFI